MHDALSNIPPTRELFAKHRITDVHIDFYPGRTYGAKCSGRIGFKHGDFESDKHFEGTDFDAVIGSMRIFLEKLDSGELIDGN